MDLLRLLGQPNRPVAILGCVLLFAALATVRPAHAGGVLLFSSETGITGPRDSLFWTPEGGVIDWPRVARVTMTRPGATDEVLLYDLTTAKLESISHAARISLDELDSSSLTDALHAYDPDRGEFVDYRDYADRNSLASVSAALAQPGTVLFFSSPVFSLSFGDVSIPAPDVDSEPPPDSDGDERPDHADNCPQVSNPTQTDTDGDGEGDACDVDDDGDGHPDTGELAAGSDPLDPNSTPEICDGADNDRDGIIDEGFADTDNDGQADCVDADAEGDGIADDYEKAHGLDPTIDDADDDLDLDGISNRDEYRYGSLPNTRTSIPITQTIALRIGLNLIGPPTDTGLINLRAFDFLQDLGGPAVVESIQRFDPDAGRFETAGYDGTKLTGTNFALSPREGYLIYMRVALDGFSLSLR